MTRAGAVLLCAWALAGCVDDGGDAVGRDASPDDAAPAPDGRDVAPVDASPADAAPRVDAVRPADAAPPLRAAAGTSRSADVGQVVRLDASDTVGAVRWQWDFGDGRGWDAPRDTPVAEVMYATPGRFRATVTAFDAAGDRDTAAVLISVTAPPSFAPRQSGSITRLPDGRVAAVVRDAGAVRFVDGLAPAGAVEVGGAPRCVAAWGDAVAVSDPSTDAVVVIEPDGGLSRVALPRGSRPFGVLALDEALFVALQGTGQVARIERGAGGAPTVVATAEAIEDARGLAALPDGRLLITRWRSPPDGGRLVALDPTTFERTAWSLAFDPQPPSDTELGGVPSYLEQALVSPQGDRVALPSLQANVGTGRFVSGEDFAHDHVLRAVVSWVDPATGAESVARRKQFDNRGLASAGVFSSRGDYLFVAMRGSRAVERYDVLTGNQAGTLLDVGYAPDGLALSADDRLLYVNATLSREVRVYDVTDFRQLPTPVAVIPLVDDEPLPAEVLRGKQLFNDSFDRRLAGDGYLACAHCHLDGDGDRLVWDFTDRGEGLRNTISLLGRAGTAHGLLHWSANFDEVQDFEHDIRGHFGGLGLMSEDAFAQADTPLGPPKAGLSADLDALAAYVGSLTDEPRSPHLRGADAEAGRAIFEQAGCDDCHRGPTLTDSGLDAEGAPVLHDVGTLGPGSGQRLGAPLIGLDTPTLHGLWHSAPYLHDGSAATLRAVLVDRNPDDRHGRTGDLTEAQLGQLEAYLLSLDGRD
ncbi:MAG: PKD domain-containing protein [Myxococcales bacterium]|nr:PKD domain-containing protein [Myxococcales bacterium]